MSLFKVVTVLETTSPHLQTFLFSFVSVNFYVSASENSFGKYMYLILEYAYLSTFLLVTIRMPLNLSSKHPGMSACVYLHLFNVFPFYSRQGYCFRCLHRAF